MNSHGPRRCETGSCTTRQIHSVPSEVCRSPALHPQSREWDQSWREIRSHCLIWPAPNLPVTPLLFILYSLSIRRQENGENANQLELAHASDCGQYFFGLHSTPRPRPDRFNDLSLAICHYYGPGTLCRPTNAEHLSGPCWVWVKWRVAFDN